MRYPAVSVIVPTYNWPQALFAVLWSLCQQTDLDFEVIVADDGSAKPTTDTIEKLKSKAPFPLRHIWQPDAGRQAAKIRNKAIAQAQNPYLVFIDGDCFVLPNFIRAHKQLAELGYFIHGQRILVNKQKTEALLQQTELLPASLNKKHWFKQRIQSQCNRFLPLLRLPLGPIRKLGRSRWQGVKTCNLGVWRQDIYAVNGFDENFVGWGYEDSDLVIRLLRHGIYRKQGRFSVAVLHLWHPPADRTLTSENWDSLQRVLVSNHTRATMGLDQYKSQPTP